MASIPNTRFSGLFEEDAGGSQGSWQLWDITPKLSPRIAVFPGDTPFSREVLLDIKRGDNLTLSTIRSTVHAGAHTDAPNHYHRDGLGMDARSIEPYLGLTQVIRVGIPRGRRITPGDLPPSALASGKFKAPRVLFATGSFPDPNQWSTDFNSLSPELVEMLASQRTLLVGIDTPSVDPADSKALEAHQAISKGDLAILEGVVLDGVPEGVYTLIALPLPIQDADASWVRAVLLKRSS